MRRSLWIIGFRGAGKTTLGQWAAPLLGREFLDMDAEWELFYQESIVDFVQREGEARFRAQEEALLRATSARLDAGEGLVVATGGGCVEWPASRKILLASAHPKLYLDLPAELLWARLKDAKERLKIGNLTSIEDMTALLEKRRPFYEKIASSAWKTQDISECLPALERLLEQP
jgi:shikimate kinase